MSAALDSAIRAAAARADAYHAAARAAAGRGSAGVLGGLFDTSAAFGHLAGQAGAHHHHEQYRHSHGHPYSACRAIANRVAGQQVRVARALPPARSRRGKAACQRPRRDALPKPFKALSADLEILERHPLLDVLADPNPWMLRWSLLYFTVMNLQITGKGYWWLWKAASPPQIWPLPASWVTQRPESSRLDAVWDVQTPGAARGVRVAGDDMFYVNLIDPADPLGAYSPLQAQARAIAADEAIAECQRRSFANGAFPGLALIAGRHPDLSNMPGVNPESMRPQLTADQRNQLVAAFKRMYQGVVHANEPIILDSLIQDVKFLTNKPREMDFIASAQFLKGRIMQGFGVNPIVNGEVEGSNRASSVTADDHFVHNTVNPLISLLSEALTAWLAPRFARKGERLVCYLEPAESYDTEMELKKVEIAAKHAAISKNTIRSVFFGLPPVPGGDTIFLAGVGEVPVDEAAADLPDLDAADLPDLDADDDADEADAEDAGEDRGAGRVSRRGFWAYHPAENGPGRDGMVSHPHAAGAEADRCSGALLRPAGRRSA